MATVGRIIDFLFDNIIGTILVVLAGIVTVISVIGLMGHGEPALFIAALLLVVAFAMLYYGIYGDFRGDWLVFLGAIVLGFLVFCSTATFVPSGWAKARTWVANIDIIPGRDTLGEQRIEWDVTTMGPAPREVAAACLSGENEYNLNNIHYRCVDVLVSLYGPEQPETVVQWDFNTHGVPSLEVRAACFAQISGQYLDPVTGLSYDCMNVNALAAVLGPGYGDARNPALTPGAGEAPLTPMPETGGADSACVEDPLAVTSFTDREVATVNGDPVDIQVRGSCPQPVYYDTTGIPDPDRPGSGAQNYDLHMPVGWTAMTASTTAEIHPDGGSAQQFLECPNVIITGPFDGGVGLYEGAIRIFPTEWTEGMIAWINPIQDAQCKFDVPITTFAFQP